MMLNKMEKIKPKNEIGISNIPPELRGTYRLFVFVLSPHEKIVTRGRTEAEAKEICMADPLTQASVKGRAYYIQAVDLLSPQEQMDIRNQYSSTHQFDWEHIPPRVLLEKAQNFVKE